MDVVMDDAGFSDVVCSPKYLEVAKLSGRELHDALITMRNKVIVKEICPESPTHSDLFCYCILVIDSLLDRVEKLESKEK